MKYREIVDEMDAVGGYISNGVGLSIREYRVLTLGEKSRADVYLKGSATYSMYLRRVDLSIRFKRVNALPAYLIWIDDLKTRTKHVPVPVLVDMKAQVVKLVSKDNYACFEDVWRCLYYRDHAGQLLEWGHSGPASADVATEHTESEVVNSDPATSRSGLMASGRRRIGQDWYRSELLRIWEGRCALTNCSLALVNKASHIKKHARCTSVEAVDPNNGLLLAAHMDSLFEHGYITFDSTGALVISTHLPPEDQVILGVTKDAKLRKYSDKIDAYMEWHRTNCFRIW